LQRESYSSVFSVIAVADCRFKDTFTTTKGETHMGGTCSCGGANKVEVAWSIPAIKCEGCADKVKTLLDDIKGVVVDRIDVAEKRLALRFNPARISEDELRGILANAGFPATGSA
jgi:copper chaperone